MFSAVLKHVLSSFKINTFRFVQNKNSSVDSINSDLDAIELDKRGDYPNTSTGSTRPILNAQELRDQLRQRTKGRKGTKYYAAPEILSFDWLNTLSVFHFVEVNVKQSYKFSL